MTPQVISLSAAGSTAWIPVDYVQNPYNINIAIVLSNTPNLTCKVEYTLDDIFNPAITPTAFTHATLTGLTTNSTGNITSPVRAIRLTVTAWTSGTATMTALQGVVNPVIYTDQGTVAGPVANQIAAIGIPFVIPAGDGAANGLQFTGSAGAFTLSAAIMTNVWNALKGCWVYMPTNFGGSGLSASWRWAVFSSDTAGVLYQDTYVSGNPTRVTSPTAFATNLTGWITTTTSEITGPTGFTLVGGAMGPSGVVKTHWRIIGNTTSTKTFKEYLGLTVVATMGITTSPVTELLTSIFNQGDQQKQGTSTANALTGVGTANTTYTVSSSATVATDVDQTISFSLHVATNTACAILLHADVTVTYGA